MRSSPAAKRLRARWRHTSARSLVVASLLALSPCAAHAQRTDDGPFLPSERLFRGPLADPMEPRLAVGLIVTDLLADQGPERPFYFLRDPDDSRSDWEAATNVGITLPLWRVAEWTEGGILIAGQAGVFGRFRIEYPSRDDLGQDWFVGMPIELKWNRWSGRVRILHRSSHLGDEFAAQTGANRIEFGNEQLDALAAYTFGSILRVYGGGAWIFRSNTAHTALLLNLGRSDRALLQAGADAELPLRPDGRIGFVAGADWQSAQRTGWRSAFAGAAGIRFHNGTRSLGLIARVFEGVSPMGEFFATHERMWSLELQGEI